MLCASTAAGPAFEGARISMGMRAATGAISEVQRRGRQAAVPRARQRRAARHLRQRPGGCGGCRLGPGLDQTYRAAGQRRVACTGAARHAQSMGRARTAVGQGRDCRRPAHPGSAMGCELEDLARIYLAGAFGNYINHASARRIGLLDFPAEKFSPPATPPCSAPSSRCSACTSTTVPIPNSAQNPPCVAERRRAVPGYVRRGDGLPGNGSRLIVSDLSQRFP